MSQTKRTYVGDYVVLKQIGSGSFSTVWLARHRIDGTEVAIKDIIMSRLNSKLHESLKSEIYILKRINHPNIIRLHDLIEEPGKMYIILEYCKGGDLSKYIQQQRGKIPEATAKHFMLQLAEGLKVLRDNNLIHRDLKPQNLLLTTNDDKSMLKIADFGFARSLQPRGLAETLCGSPLYMAPEIMQLQKYDAKADLWSVGTILFQLVTGKPPYTGINQIQLLQNIIKSGELQFPPEAKDLSPHCVDLCKKLLRRNPVERLTFEEFFNHPYFPDTKPDESSREGAPDDSPRFGGNTVESSPDYCLPFILDEDSSGTDGSPNPRRPNMASAYRFSLPDRKESFSLANQKESHSQCYSSRTAEITGSKGGSHHLLQRNMKDSRSVTDPGPLGNHPKVMDSLESIDQDYVIVSGPPLDSYSSVCASKPNNLPSKANSPARDPGMMNTTSAPRSINDVASGRVTCTTSQEKQISALKTLEGSVNIEQPASDAMTRIKSLQHFASSIAELVNEKIDGGKHLDAFSVQLVVLAIWKQALHICHTDAASACEVNPWHNTPTSAGVSKVKHSIHTQGYRDAADLKGLQDISSQIESAFLHEVQNAEELAKVVLPGNVEIPDAMEVIYQSALDLGRHGAVDEYMGKTDNAVFFYSKAVSLLQFILVEAPCLILNPPFSLTNADRYRIKNYIDVLSNRQSISESQRIALFKTEDQPIIRS